MASVIVCKNKQLTVFAASQSSKDDIQFMGPPITDIRKLSKMENDVKAKMELLCLKIQADLCKSLGAIEQEEESHFTVQRSPEKGVLLCYQEEEEIFEKASIEVVNKKIEPSIRVIGIFASIFPKNPNIPSLQLDLVYTEEESEEEVDSSTQKVNGSFSGRVLLVPYVYNEEDFRNYHRTLKRVCDKHCRDCYIKFKSLSDEDSQLGGKAVGVGGISFPAAGSGNISPQFLESVAGAVIPLYVQLIEKHKEDNYTYNDRMWQLSTRGRQALNFMNPQKSRLLNDADSCTIHLPPMTKWFVESPKAGSKQEPLVEIIEKPKEWL